MAERPSLLALQDYATKTARRMFPDQKGVDDQQDAARHMLAAGLVAQRFGPGVARAAGVGHEVIASPLVLLRSLFGGKRPLSYDEDTHNNALGARLGAMTDSQTELENLVKMLAAQSVDINKQRREEDQPWMGKSDDEAIERQTYGYAMGGVVTQPVQDEDDGFAKGGIVQYDPARVQQIIDRFATGGAVHMARGGSKPQPMPVEGSEAIDVANPLDESVARFSGALLRELPGAARRTVEGNIDLAGLLARYVLGSPGQKAAMISKVPGAAEAVYEAAKTELPKIPARVASASPEDFGRLMAQYSADTLLDPMRLGKTQTMTNIMKPKGGNWVNNAEKQLIDPLRPRLPSNRDEALALGGRWTALADDPEMQSTFPRNAAINDWLENKLSKYMKNEMGTEADPVRALAERGILHYHPTEYLAPTSRRIIAERNRALADMPLEPVGTSQLAKDWEESADAIINPAQPYRLQIPMVSDRESADNYLRNIGGEFAVKNPNAPAYSFNKDVGSNSLLGFNHMVDELKNAMSVNTDLPMQLRLKPEDLSKISVPQAVQLVDKINKWRGKEALKAERAGMLENLRATPRAADQTLNLSFVDKPGGTWVDIPETSSKEGMKFCKTVGKQGGWCTQEQDAALRYGSGTNRLSLLLDSDGRPHVQVMMNKVGETGDLMEDVDRVLRHLTFSQQEKFNRFVSSEDFGGDFTEVLDWTRDNAPRAYEKLIKAERNSKPSISEIKPVGNDFDTKQAREYSRRDPQYREKVSNSVLNFLNSGDWGTVADLHHYKITDIENYSPNTRKVAAELFGEKRFLTEQEMDKVIKVDLARQDKLDTERRRRGPRYATGGAVRMARGGANPIPMPVEGGAAIDVANPQDDSVGRFGMTYAAELPGSAVGTAEGTVDFAKLISKYVISTPAQKAAMLSKFPELASAAWEMVKRELPQLPEKIAKSTPEDLGRLAARYTTDTLLDPMRGIGKIETMSRMSKPTKTVTRRGMFNLPEETKAGELVPVESPVTTGAIAPTRDEMTEIAAKLMQEAPVPPASSAKPGKVSRRKFIKTAADVAGATALPVPTSVKDLAIKTVLEKLPEAPAVKPSVIEKVVKEYDPYYDDAYDIVKNDGDLIYGLVLDRLGLSVPDKKLDTYLDHIRNLHNQDAVFEELPADLQSALIKQGFGENPKLIEQITEQELHSAATEKADELRSEGRHDEDYDEDHDENYDDDDEYRKGGRVKMAQGGAVQTVMKFDPARVQNIIKNFQEVYNA